jgi:steroid 5-alpha reductase family enzyme
VFFQMILAGFLVVNLMMLLLWLISLIKKDASIVDRVWGLGFVLLAVTYTYLAPNWSWRLAFMTMLVSIWGLRLSWHIHARNRGKPEDYRYKSMRKKAGPSWWWKSYVSVFLLQGALMMLIATPMLLLALVPGASRVTFLDMLGGLVWAIGFAFEAIGDQQLKEFKANPKNKGKVCNIGLWDFTRHPNYFGDAAMWWGIFLLSMNSYLGIFGVFGPALMTFFIVRISGVMLLEQKLMESKPGYRQYCKDTPAFFPSIRKMVSKGKSTRA